ncbi:MAG: hypothetical protein R3B48_14250 [Kofleriaceae bacterium]
MAVTGNASFALARGVADDSRTRTWFATDLRLGAMVGKSLLDNRLVLHAATRVFGGPVSWRRANEDVVGGDRYHITAGAGATWHAGALSLSMEVMPLGEQSYVAGAIWNL